MDEARVLAEHAALEVAMNKKMRFTLASVLIIVLAGACASTAQEQACGQLEACGVGGASGTCPSTLSECAASCINRASCDELLDARSGAPTIGLGFLACKTKCDGP